MGDYLGSQIVKIKNCLIVKLFRFFERALPIAFSFLLPPLLALSPSHDLSRNSRRENNLSYSP